MRRGGRGRFSSPGGKDPAVDRHESVLGVVGVKVSVDGRGVRQQDLEISRGYKHSSALYVWCECASIAVCAETRNFVFPMWTG